MKCQIEIFQVLVYYLQLNKKIILTLIMKFDLVDKFLKDLYAK